MTKLKVVGIVAGALVALLCVAGVIDLVHGDFGYTVSMITGDTSYTSSASADAEEVVASNNDDKAMSAKETSDPDNNSKDEETSEENDSDSDKNNGKVEATKEPEAASTVKPTVKPTSKAEEPKETVAAGETKKPETTVTPTKKPEKPKTENNGKKVAYLTFDDGPSDNTMKILDILDKYNAKATFFVIYHKDSEDKYKKLAESGNLIALHSYTHDYKTIYKSEDAYFNDLNKIHDYVLKVTGIDSNILRFPGGSSNTISRKYQKGIMSKLTKSVESKGFSYFDWGVDSTDASGNGVKKEILVRNVVEGSKGLSSTCILMHDTSAKNTTVDALPEIIEGLRKQGFTFEVLSKDSKPCHHGVNN